MTDEEILDEVVFPIEGGRYTNDPDDPGGPTRWGITIPVLSKHRGHPVTAWDIEHLTRNEAGEVYKSQFFSPFQLIHGDLRVNAIDFGINAGVYRAAVILQEIVGATVDGKIGPETAGRSATRDWNALYTGARVLFYEDLILRRPRSQKYRNGWRRRALAHIEPELRRTFRAVETEPIFGPMGKAFKRKAA